MGQRGITGGSKQNVFLADDQMGNSHIEMLISLLYFPSLTKKYCM